MNSNEKIILITFDLKKASDCVDHKILLKKLKYICDEKSVKLFDSYLQNRHSFVLHNRQLSNAKVLNLSVPQGGCLAPLLFIIFMNDITKLKLRGQLYLFCDDMSLVIKSKNYKDLQNYIQQDLHQIYQWLKRNRLVLNYSKTNYILMGSPKEASILNIKPNINEILIQRVMSSKILGLHIDNNLRYETHINKLCKELNSRISLFNRLKKYSPGNTLNFLYKSFVRPKLEYGIVLWGFTYETHLENLIKIQKRFARIITNSGYLSHSSPFFQRLNWKTQKV